MVCCRDAADQPVARPLPSDWTRTEVTDAEMPCPACGALASDEVLPTDGSRGGRGGHGHDGPLEPCRITVWRIRGHEEGAGHSIFRFGSTDEPEDEAAVAERRARSLAHQRVQKWYSDKQTLRAVAFPIYAAEDWSAQIGGSGDRTGDDVDHLTVNHYTSPDPDPSEDRPRLKVATSIEDLQDGDSQLRHARRTLEMRDHGDHTTWPDVSDAALKVWLGVRHREARAAAYAATQSDHLITIDATPEPFLKLSAAPVAGSPSADTTTSRSPSPPSTSTPRRSHSSRSLTPPPASSAVGGGWLRRLRRGGRRRSSADRSGTTGGR